MGAIAGPWGSPCQRLALGPQGTSSRTHQQVREPQPEKERRVKKERRAEDAKE